MKIRRELLQMIMESAKDTYPKEFAAFLRAENDVIYEILMLPGTISGKSSALYQLYMKPIDFSIVGTVHSHPSGVLYPSPEDLDLFSKTGKIHIIVGYPFSIENFKCYDRNGKEVELRIL